MILPQPGKGLWEWLRRQEQYCSYHGERNYFTRTGCCSQFVQVQHLTPYQAEMLSTAEGPHSSLWEKKGGWRWNVWRLLGSTQKLTAKEIWETGNFNEFCLNTAWSLVQDQALVAEVVFRVFQHQISLRRITKSPSTICTTDIFFWHHCEIQVAGPYFFFCLS